MNWIKLKRTKMIKERTRSIFFKFRINFEKIDKKLQKINKIIESWKRGEPIRKTWRNEQEFEEKKNWKPRWKWNGVNFGKNEKNEKRWKSRKKIEKQLRKIIEEKMMNMDTIRQKWQAN